MRPPRGRRRDRRNFASALRYRNLCAYRWRRTSAAREGHTLRAGADRVTSRDVDPVSVRRPSRPTPRRAEDVAPAARRTTDGQPERRRLPTRTPARVGDRARVRLRRGRHQRHPRRLGPRGQPAAVRPGPARGDVRIRSRRLREVHRPGRGVHGHLRAGRGAPAQRPLRRQTRPRPGGRDRRADQPHRHGRLLSAGDRPTQPLQGRRQRLRADGHRPAATAQRPRPGHPGGPDPTRPPPP